MFRNLAKLFISGLVVLALLLPQFSIKAEAKGKRHKKVGFFTRMKRNIKHKVKMTAKKVHRKIVKAGAGVQNKIMDSAVKTRSALTGKKPRKVWVRGHYKKGNRHHTKGHWKTVRRSHKPHSHPPSSPPVGNPSPAPVPSPTPAPAPMNPPAINTGAPLPPLDPVLPSFSIKAAKKRR